MTKEIAEAPRHLLSAYSSPNGGLFVVYGWLSVPILSTTPPPLVENLFGIASGRECV